MKNSININWGRYGRDLETLYNKVKKYKSEYTGVYGIPMGGQLIAMYLSNKLKLPLLLKPTSKCLIVDDISDTGFTLSTYINKYVTATLYKTPWTKTNPNFSVRVIKKSKKEWVVFPYE